MSVIGSGGISASTFSTTDHWKPVSSGPTAAGGAKSGGQTVDSLSMSKLGQALVGKSADIFKHLDPKARAMLDDIVTSGKASADEVVKRMQYLAENAKFDRYVKETPNTAAEDSAFQKAYAQFPDQKAAYDVINQVAQGRKAAHSALAAARSAVTR